VNRLNAKPVTTCLEGNGEGGKDGAPGVGGPDWSGEKKKKRKGGGRRRVAAFRLCEQNFTRVKVEKMN